MNVLEIVQAKLRDLGADGLTDEDECGCSVEDLAPCGAIGHHCVAAKLGPCSGTCGGCDGHMYALEGEP